MSEQIMFADRLINQELVGPARRTGLQAFHPSSIIPQAARPAGAPYHFTRKDEFYESLIKLATGL
jgi:hypothetical protein